eukprot:1112726-Pyramimonas_sp.AAC.1
MRNSTDGPSGTARMRHAPPNTALRGPIGNSTEGHCPHASRTTQYSVSWPYQELRRRSQCHRPHASRTTQYSASWPYGELHRRSQWRSSHASRTT